MNRAEDLTRPLTHKATQGDTDAMLKLARVYYQGEHSDAARFFEWTRQAAEAGDTGAMFNLALAYFNGTGTEPDTGKFFEWTQAGARAGDATAMFNLALAYDRGTGTEPDLKPVFQMDAQGRQRPAMPAPCSTLPWPTARARAPRRILKAYGKWTRRAAEAGRSGCIVQSRAQLRRG